MEFDCLQSDKEGEGCFNTRCICWHRCSWSGRLVSFRVSRFLFWSDIIYFILISGFCNDSFPLRRRRRRLHPPAGWSQLALTSHRSSQLTSFIVKKQKKGADMTTMKVQREREKSKTSKKKKRILSRTITIIITTMGTGKAFLTWLCYLEG